jgi:hypothetical protein
MVRAGTFLLLIILTNKVILSAQENLHELELEIGSSVGTGENIPFWLITNQYGLLDNQPFNLYSRLAYKKAFSELKRIDFSAGLSLVNRFSDHYTIYPEEAYGIVRVHFLDFSVGLKKEIFGNHNHILGSGGMLWSGNARPIPKISISTPDYIDVPFTYEYLEIKGGISHGWFGRNQFVDNALLHHKYIYGRAGGDLPVNFTIGMHHYAQWGGHSSDPNYGKLPSDLKAFKNVFFAGAGKENSPLEDQKNAAGNHLGSYNLGLDIELQSLSIDMYWQSIFEDNSGRTNQNLWDGLYGVSLEFKKKKFIEKFILEMLVTTFQSGVPQLDYPEESTPPEWNDNYFNNWLYGMGWSYKEMTLGNPLITSPIFLIRGSQYNYFKNNRVRALHMGISGNLSSVKYRLLYSYSINFGTYIYPFHNELKQSYFLLELFYENIFSLTDLSLSMGFDSGNLAGNNGGLHIKILRRIEM